MLERDKVVWFYHLMIVPSAGSFSCPHITQLFDALFEIHVIELSHRGRDATKNLADERYANIPDGTVRAFLDNCPTCNARRGGGAGAGGHCSSFVDEELVMDDDDEEEVEGQDDVRFP